MKRFSFIAFVAVFTALTVLSCKKDVTGVQLDKTNLVVLLSQTANLTATVEPDNAANKNVTWESSHPEVATIANGLVTAVATGKTNITVHTEDGDKTATCVVIVKRNLTDPDPEGFGLDAFVSQSVETSTFLLEELTGVSCPNCPYGHKIADDLAANTFPNKLFVINVHSTSYAVPSATYPDDLRTSFGDALVSYSKLTGVPAGMINRMVFASPLPQSGQSPAMSRGNWATAANSIANNSTYVNVAAKTTINSADRTLTCKVQVYYTSDVSVAINNLNVAVLQNEIVAKQSGGSYYPERVTPDGKYRHMHVLRHLITGQWGEAIASSEMKRGNLYEKTFTWTIPADMRTIPIPLANVEVLVFVTEGAQAPVAKVCKSSIVIK